MLYKSTRNASIKCSFEDAICSGYAPDGGLFVPNNLPKIDDDTLGQWMNLTFPQLAFEILRRFISVEEINDEELNMILDKSFVTGFDMNAKSQCPVIRVGSAYVAELFHGPTFCFKDFGMRPVVNILSHFATKRKKKITLIVSTTGDTGPAAVQAVSDSNNPYLTLLVHYPHGQISDFQRKQLTTVDSPYVHVATFEGGGDDMDLPIKNIQASCDDDSETMICGVNSYNIGRPLFQMVHFVWTYLRVIEESGLEPNKEVDIILPTGAMGNIAGGFMAKKMGVNIGKLCAGVNINDITHRAISNGKFHKSERMEKTLSEAINIQVPYNFERLLFYLTNENHSLVKQWMEQMDAKSKLDLDSNWHSKLQSDFCSARITDEEMCNAMRKVKEKYHYFIDPHTAIAIAAAEKLGYDLYDENEVTNGTNSDSRPYAILSTASPCKFEESVNVALGKEGWDEYYDIQFPNAAKSVITKAEVCPTLYPYIAGKSLLDVQSNWERLAKNLIDKLVR